MADIILTSVLISVALGAAGGAIRAVMTAVKLKQIYKNTSISTFPVILGIYLIVGSLSGLLLNSSKVMSFLGGYMAVDLMEVYHKNFKKMKVK